MKLQNENQVRMALAKKIQREIWVEESDPNYVIRCIKKATDLNATATIMGRRYLILPIIEKIDNYWYRVVKLVVGDSHKYDGLNVETTVEEIVIDF